MQTPPSQLDFVPSDPSDFKIDIRFEGSTTVIALSGRIHGGLSVVDRDRVMAVVRPGSQLLLDFSEVQEITGAAFRRLLLLTRYVAAWAEPSPLAEHPSTCRR